MSALTRITAEEARNGQGFTPALRFVYSESYPTLGLGEKARDPVKKMVTR